MFRIARLALPAVILVLNDSSIAADVRSEKFDAEQLEHYHPDCKRPFFSWLVPQHPDQKKTDECSPEGIFKTNVTKLDSAYESLNDADYRVLRNKLSDSNSESSISFGQQDKLKMGKIGEATSISIGSSNGASDEVVKGFILRTK